jgi:hypothetical protein
VKARGMRLGRVGAVGPGADDLPAIIETEEQTSFNIFDASGR